MARTKTAPKQEAKVYPPGYFDYTPDDGIDRTEEIVSFLFCPENGDLRDSPELKQMARSAFATLTDEPKSLLAIAQEMDLLGRQLPLLYVLNGMVQKGMAIGDVRNGFHSNSNG